MTRLRWYRLALSGLLLISVIWLWSTRYDELIYHTITKGDLIDLGDATSFNKRAQEIPYNSYVEVRGILGNKAATLSGLRAGSFRFGRYQVRQILGSPLYLEYDQDLYHHKFSPFSEVTVKGRLIPFGTAPELEKVREFFKSYYHQPVDAKAMLVVVDEAPRTELRYGILFIVSILLVVFSFYSSFRAFKLDH